MERPRRAAVVVTGLPVSRVPLRGRTGRAPHCTLRRCWAWQEDGGGGVVRVETGWRGVGSELLTPLLL